jgi:hypothetical protein
MTMREIIAASQAILLVVFGLVLIDERRWQWRIAAILIVGGIIYQVLTGDFNVSIGQLLYNVGAIVYAVLTVLRKAQTA